MNAPSRLLSHKGYLALAAIIVVLMIAFLWIVFAPGPMHFASGRAVRLADYRGPDPTGVPANIAQASLIVHVTEFVPMVRPCTRRCLMPVTPT
jgi:hypothetical protein